MSENEIKECEFWDDKDQISYYKNWCRRYNKHCVDNCDYRQLQQLKEENEKLKLAWGAIEESHTKIENENTALQKQVDELTSDKTYLEALISKDIKKYLTRNSGIELMFECLTLEMFANKEKLFDKIKIYNKQLLSEKQILLEGLEKISDTVCQTGCRYEDKDCTPDNCIIRYFKDIAKQIIERIEG